LSLSALGASLDLDGAWSALLAGGGEGIAADLVGWRQLTSQGRDQYVRIVEAGYLFPLGHRAVLIEVIDRVFAPDPNSPSSYADAYLQSRTFIRVVEPTKAYPATGQPFPATTAPYAATTWPFASAQLLTLVTPDIVEPTQSPAPAPLGSVNTPPGSYPQAFFPYDVQTMAPVNWSVHLIDLAGTVVHLHVPLAFIFGESGATYPPTFPPSSPPTGYSLSVFSASAMATVANAYNAYGLQGIGTTERAFVTSPISGTPILYAPEVTDAHGNPHPGGTTHPTLSITLGAATAAYAPVAPVAPATTLVKVDVATPASTSELEGINQPAFYPALLSAQVRLPAAETLSRGPLDDADGAGVTIGFYSGAANNYVTQGYPTTLPATPTGGVNAGAVYASLLNQPALTFPADAVGGIANPNFQMTGLAAAAGVIGGSLDTYASNAAANVLDYFNNLQSDLSSFLGGLPFIGSAIAMGPQSGIDNGPTDPLPGILGQSFDGSLNGVPGITHEYDPGPPATETVGYTMVVPLSAWAPGASTPPTSQDDALFWPLPDGSGSLTLTATVVVAQDGSATYSVQGTMTQFDITILDDGLQVIQIPFGNDSQPGATFSAGTGSKTSIQVNVGSPTFLGPLAFVNQLQDFLNNIGGSGLSIDVAPTSVSVSLKLAIPSIGCGVFDLENLALSAGVVVPFLDGATVATFGFCSQEQPFTLTVMCFGGGGYVLMSVGLHSVQSVTASFDFEGELALDLGVASGGVSVAAGITVMYANPGGTTLTGFVKIDGWVSVLEIISISLSVELMLGYTTPNTVTGTATMQISVSICFFSVSVGVTITKSFQGPSVSSGPRQDGPLAIANGSNPFPPPSAPTFANMMASGDWSTYCNAFAA
jgi:hypothetical protein